MIVLMIVTFYTTRVSLQVLGVDDYGIYNLIAGVIALFSFVYAVLETSIQRFLNYEIGHKDEVAVNTIFSSSLLIMTGLSLVLLIFAETLGLIGVSKLNIPENRFDVALVVFHISVLQFCAGLIKVPYNSAIIAYEKMDKSGSTFIGIDSCYSGISAAVRSDCCTSCNKETEAECEE